MKLTFFPVCLSVQCTEPRETRQIKQYWTSFFAASKAKSVSKKASLLAEKMYKENITASVESLLTKIERTPFWSGSYLASVGLDKDEAAVITEELKKRKAVKSSKQQEERKGTNLHLHHFTSSIRHSIFVRHHDSLY